MTETLLIVAALVLVLACGGFVAAEFAFIGVDRATVEREAVHDKRARGTLTALRQLSTQLSGAQLGITVTNLAIGFLAEPAVAALLAGPLEAAGLSSGAAAGVSLTVALVLSTAVTMIFGELVPKNLAIARPLSTARAVQGFQRGFTAATRPLITLLNGSSNVVVRAFGVEPQEELASARSPEELFSLVRRSAQEGTLDAGTATLVQRAMAFTDRDAADVMVPRGQMQVMTVGESVADLVGRSETSGHSRFPVLSVDGRDVAGVVDVHAALEVVFEQRGATAVQTLARPPEVVPETIDLDQLLTRLRKREAQLALVVDEYGDLAGLVTLEDLVEEIVGEVVDEHDTRQAPVRAGDDGSVTATGRVRPDEASELLGLSLPESEDWDTMAGLVMTRLGRLPEPGESVTVQATRPGEGVGEQVTVPVEITVEGMDRWRLALLRLRPLPPDPPDGADGAAPAAASEGGPR